MLLNFKHFIFQIEDVEIKEITQKKKKKNTSNRKATFFPTLLNDFHFSKSYIMKNRAIFSFRFKVNLKLQNYVQVFKILRMI